MANSLCSTRTGRPVPFVAALRRWPGSALVLALAAAALWVILRPWVSQRTVSFDLHLAGSGIEWALEWQRATDGLRNGAWLDVAPEPELPNPEPLEIRILGCPDGSDKTVELWLYHVYPLSQQRKPDGTPRFAKPDLKRIIAEADEGDRVGHWVPFEADEGIVFYGVEGWLRFDAPAGGVRLHLARTADGGVVSLRYANTEKTLNLRTPCTEYVQVELRRRAVVADTTVRIRRTLPNYPLGALALRWGDSRGARIGIRGVRLTETVFGIPVRQRNLTAQLEEGADVVDTAAGWLQLAKTAAAGSISLRGRTSFGFTAFGAGYVITLAVLILLTWLVPRIPPVPWQVLTKPASWVPIAIVLVVAVRVWMALWAPLLVTYDGVQYFSNAQSFLDTGSTERFGGGGFRMPGYSLVLALFLQQWHDFGTALVVFQALLGVGTALCCWDMLRRLLPAPWPALVLLYVGLDPVLLTYEHLALTECLSTFCVTVITWLALRWAQPAAGGARPGKALCSAALLGVLCGLAAYVRSSLLVLFAAVPLALLLLGWRPGGRRVTVLQAGVVALGAVACILPWVWRNSRLLGQAEFAPFGAVQKLASLWDADALDLNQTPAYTFGQWRDMRAAGYFPHTQIWILLQQSVLAEARGQEFWRSQEIRAEFLADEAMARRPLNMIRGGFIAFCNQIGLWNKLKQHSGRENMHWSRALRGDPFTSTNLFDGYAVEDYVAARKRLPDIQRNTWYLHGSPNALSFNDLFFSYEFTRPVIGVLFLAGLGLAWRRGCRALGAVGLIALAHVAGMSIIVLSAIDRYGVPFKPLIAVVAFYALHQVVQRWRTAAARTKLAPAS